MLVCTSFDATVVHIHAALRRFLGVVPLWFTGIRHTFKLLGACLSRSMTAFYFILLKFERHSAPLPQELKRKGSFWGDCTVCAQSDSHCNPVVALCNQECH
jgi:hypothetical protein